MTRLVFSSEGLLIWCAENFYNTARASMFLTESGQRTRHNCLTARRVCGESISGESSPDRADGNAAARSRNRAPDGCPRYEIRGRFNRVIAPAHARKSHVEIYARTSDLGNARLARGISGIVECEPLIQVAHSVAIESKCGGVLFGGGKRRKTFPTEGVVVGRVGQLPLGKPERLG